MDDRELYNHDGLVIEVSEIDPGSHNVWLGGKGKDYFFLPYGVLEQVACSRGFDQPREIFKTLGRDEIGPCLRDSGISFERLVLAIAQARNEELKRELEYHIHEANRARGLV